MEGSVAALWITTSATAVGVIYTIVKNGRSRTKKDTELKVELKKDIESIQKKPDDPDDGLGAIRREISGIKEHCAGITSGFEQRLTGLEGNRCDRHQ